jgi:hypothetical protein
MARTCWAAFVPGCHGTDFAIGAMCQHDRAHSSRSRLCFRKIGVAEVVRVSSRRGWVVGDERVVTGRSMFRCCCWSSCRVVWCAVGRLGDCSEGRRTARGLLVETMSQVSRGCRALAGLVEGCCRTMNIAFSGRCCRRRAALPDFGIGESPGQRAAGRGTGGAPRDVPGGR